MTSVEPFADNWAYLKAELIWLDRLLSLTVARQRKQTKEVDRVSRTAADRATSHWWKGLVSLEGIAAYDSPAETPARQLAPKVSFQQQLAAKIQVSQEQGIALGLPMLRDRLQLSSFEKNLVLLALAPEISRRYGRLYSYLQEPEPPISLSSLPSIGWPSVDLMLRLLCHTDRDWQQGRQRLTIAAPLVQQGLVEIVGSPLPFLSRSVKLCDRLTDYLLSELPSPTRLEHLLAVGIETDRELLQVWQPTLAEPQLIWSNLVLPEPLLESLQQICNPIRLAPQIDRWGFGSETAGTVALLAGAAGTGKTTAARTIAQSLLTPLFSADLRSLHPTDFPLLLRQIEQRSPTLLLLKNAHLWLGRAACLPPSDLHRLLDQRRQFPSLTLLSLERSQAIQPQWRRRLDRSFNFPLPNEFSRLRLWQSAFPPQVPLDTRLNWSALAQQVVLSGGEIQAIARLAASRLATQPPGQSLSLSQIQTVLLEAGYVKQQTKRDRGLL